MEEAVGVLAAVFREGGHEMVDLAGHAPHWTGVDNPDGLTTALRFASNTCLYVTAKA